MFSCSASSNIMSCLKKGSHRCLKSSFLFRTFCSFDGEEVGKEHSVASDAFEGAKEGRRNGVVLVGISPVFSPGSAILKLT